MHFHFISTRWRKPEYLYHFIQCPPPLRQVRADPNPAEEARLKRAVKENWPLFPPQDLSEEATSKVFLSTLDYS